MSSGTASDSIDLVEVARVLRRGWRTVALAVVAGVGLAALVIALAPRRFDGATSLLIRTGSSGGGALLARLGLGEAGGLLPGGAAASQLDTEVEILQSRALAGEVVDSLGLQVEVESPAGAAAMAVVRETRLGGSFRPVEVALDRENADDPTWRVEGSGAAAFDAPVGQPIRLPEGTLVLTPAADSLTGLELRLLDREDAVTAFGKRLGVRKARGEVLHVSFRAADSVTAARVPNALAAAYVALRRQSDRGTNQHRVTFLAAQIDSVQAELAGAERALQEFQESSGVLDGPTISRVQIERAGELRQELGTLDVELGALERLQGQVDAGRMSSRQLAAFPTFLRSGAINDLLSQMSELETERVKLLERRLETDQEVVALDRSIAALEGQLVPLAAAYRTSLTQQRAELAGQMQTLQAGLGALPSAIVTGGRLQRDVLRLGQIHGALQAQLVEARLAAVGEGGDVRVLDAAQPAKRAAFPPKVATAAAGLGGGLAVGVVVVLVGGLLGRYVEDPRAIERAAGVPALQLEVGMPLLVGTANTSTVLLLPLEERVSTDGVAERLARTAMARSIQATVLDLTGSRAAGMGDETVSRAIERLESEHGLVIVQLPGLGSDATVGALSRTRPVLVVTPAGRVDRRQLLDTIESLRRVEAPCAGVVMSRSSDSVLLKA